MGVYVYVILHHRAVTVTGLCSLPVVQFNVQHYLRLQTSTTRSCRHGSSAWSCRVWPARSAPYPSWWRSSSTTSRCTASTQRASTGSRAPPIRSKNSDRGWTRVRLTHRSMRHTFQIHITGFLPGCLKVWNKSESQIEKIKILKSTCRHPNELVLWVKMCTVIKMWFSWWLIITNYKVQLRQMALLWKKLIFNED